MHIVRCLRQHSQQQGSTVWSPCAPPRSFTHDALARSHTISPWLRSAAAYARPRRTRHAQAPHRRLHIASHPHPAGEGPLRCVASAHRGTFRYRRAVGKGRAVADGHRDGAGTVSNHVHGPAFLRRGIARIGKAVGRGGGARFAQERDAAHTCADMSHPSHACRGPPQGSRGLMKSPCLPRAEQGRGLMTHARVTLAALATAAIVCVPCIALSQ